MNETQLATSKLLQILKGPNVKRNLLYFFIGMSCLVITGILVILYLNRQALNRDFLHVPGKLIASNQIDLYLERGGDINTLDEKGENCLFNVFSTSKGVKVFSQSDLEFLINRGAQITVLNPAGENILTQYILHTDLDKNYLTADSFHRETFLNNLIILKNLGFDIKLPNKKGDSAWGKIKNIPEVSQIFSIEK